RGRAVRGRPRPHVHRRPPVQHPRRPALVRTGRARRRRVARHRGRRATPRRGRYTAGDRLRARVRERQRRHPLRAVLAGPGASVVTEVPPRPAPEITGHAAPFWAAARDGRLVIQHCPACGHYQHYPRPWCTNCLHETPEFVESRGEGTIYTFTVIR